MAVMPAMPAMPTQPGQVDTHCPYCALQCGTTRIPHPGTGMRVVPRLFPTNRGGFGYDELVLATGSQTWLARRAGLRVNRGIVVDDRMATSVPRVHAIGECAEHRGACYGLVGPCWEQADVLADLLTGADPAARYTGSSLVTRLKARDVDLAAMGEIGAGALPDGELVQVSDAARGRYGALALRDAGPPGTGQDVAGQEGAA